MNIFSALQEMLFLITVAVCIIGIPTLIIGVVISIFQAATQINEMTLTFIPKLITVLLLLYVLGPWMMDKLVMITHQYFVDIPNYIR